MPNTVFKNKSFQGKEKREEVNELPREETQAEGCELLSV